MKNNDIEEKLKRLDELRKERDKIDREIEKILTPQKVVAMPSNFSLNDEILAVVEVYADNVDGTITSKKIYEKLREKYPGCDLERLKVNTALTYLKGPHKKLLDNPRRGVYKKRQSSDLPAQK